MTHDRHRPRPRSARRRLRKEDARLVTGRTRWTENIALPGMLHLAILRSPYAHARITRVDTSAARPRPNVIAVVQRGRHRRHPGRAGLRLAGHRGHASRRPTCRSRSTEVRHVGEPVAVVVARDQASAVDALDAIEVDYEPLPVVLDLEAALAAGLAAGALRRGHQQGVHLDLRLGATPAPAATSPTGRRPRSTITRRYVQQRLIPAFMEPRSVIVDPSGGEWTMYSATQIPHILRFLLAATTGTPGAQDPGRSRRTSAAGSAASSQVTPEEWIAFAVAAKVGRPVKYTETRSRVAALGAPRPRHDPGPHADRHAATAR